MGYITHSCEVVVCLFHKAQLVGARRSSSKSASIDDRVITKAKQLLYDVWQREWYTRWDDRILQPVQSQYMCVLRKIIPDKRGVEVGKLFHVLLCDPEKKRKFYEQRFMERDVLRRPWLPGDSFSPHKMAVLL